MAAKDQKNNFDVKQSIVPVTSSGNITGAEADVTGFEAVTLVCDAGLLTTGTIKIQEASESGGSYADVSASHIIGTQDVAVAPSGIVTLGYIGNYGFLRAVFTESAAGPISASFVCGVPHIAPTGAN